MSKPHQPLTPPLPAGSPLPPVHPFVSSSSPFARDFSNRSTAAEWSRHTTEAPRPRSKLAVALDGRADVLDGGVRGRVRLGDGTEALALGGRLRGGGLAGADGGLAGAVAGRELGRRGGLGDGAVARLGDGERLDRLVGARLVARLGHRVAGDDRLGGVGDGGLGLDGGARAGAERFGLGRVRDRLGLVARLDLGVGVGDLGLGVAGRQSVAVEYGSRRGPTHVVYGLHVVTGT